MSDFTFKNCSTFLLFDVRPILIRKEKCSSGEKRNGMSHFANSALQKGESCIHGKLRGADGARLYVFCPPL